MCPLRHSTVDDIQEFDKWVKSLLPGSSAFNITSEREEKIKLQLGTVPNFITIQSALEKYGKEF